MLNQTLNMHTQKIEHGPSCNALGGNRTPGGSMATTQVTTTPLMLYHNVVLSIGSLFTSPERLLRVCTMVLQHDPEVPRLHPVQAVSTWV